MDDFNYDTVKHWTELATNVVDRLTDDVTSNVMMIAMELRKTYISGKKDGVKEWNQGER